MMEFRYEEDFLKPEKTYLAAGFDLKSNEEEFYLEAGAFTKVRTGTRVKLSRDSFGLIKPRSGLSAKYGIDVLAGVVDEDYRGEIIVVLFNSGKKHVHITRGMRIAQLVPIKLADNEALMTKGDSFEEETERGSKGFGSSGMM